MSQPGKTVNATDVVLRRIARIHGVVPEAFERATGMRLARCRILLLVSGTGGCTQKYITESVGVDAASVARQLLLLEEEGFVRREDDPKDRRRSVVVLTVDGAKLVRSVAVRRDAFLAKALAGIPPDDWEITGATLDRVLKNIAGAG